MDLNNKFNPSLAKDFDERTMASSKLHDTRHFDINDYTTGYSVPKHNVNYFGKEVFSHTQELADVPNISLGDIHKVTQNNKISGILNKINNAKLQLNSTIDNIADNDEN